MEPEGFEPSSSPLRLGVLEQLPGTPARCNRRPHAAAPCRECSVMETARTRSSSVQARCSAVRASSRVCCVRSRYSSGTRAPLEHPGDLAQRLDQGVAGGQGRSDAVAAVPNHVPVALPCEADRGRLAAVLEPPVAVTAARLTDSTTPERGRRQQDSNLPAAIRPPARQQPLPCQLGHASTQRKERDSNPQRPESPPVFETGCRARWQSFREWPRQASNLQPSA
jgi:hypothetical protein